MTNYREILRLNSLGLNKTQIAEVCGCSRTNRLSYPLPEGMSDKQLAEALFPASAVKLEYKMPDYEYVAREMQKSGVTLKANHQKYIQWNGERFIKWASKIGESTAMVVKAILGGYRVEQQGYKACMGLLKLADK